MDTVTFGALFLGTFLIIPQRIRNALSCAKSKSNRKKCVFFCFDASPGLLARLITNLLFTCLWWGWDVALSRAVLFIAKLASIAADWILLNPFFWHWREHRTVLTPVWEQRVRFYWHHSPAEDWRVTNLSLERTTGFWRPLWPHQSTTDNRRTFALMSVDCGSTFNWWEGRMCVTIFVFLAKTGTTPESMAAALSAAALHNSKMYLSWPLTSLLILLMLLQNVIVNLWWKRLNKLNPEFLLLFCITDLFCKRPKVWWKEMAMFMWSLHCFCFYVPFLGL